MRRDTVAELVIRQPILVRSDMPVNKVAALMRSRQLGCAFVVDEQSRPLGKFTQRQLMKILVEDPSKLQGPVENAMYRHAEWVRIDEPISKIVELMSNEQIRYLAVVDREGKVIGLTGQKGLIEYIVEHFPRQVKVERMKSLIAMDTKEGA